MDDYGVFSLRLIKQLGLSSRSHTIRMIVVGRSVDVGHIIGFTGQDSTAAKCRYQRHSE